MSLMEIIKSGERIYGTAVVSPSVKWLDVINKANLDFVFLDSEHIPMGRETLANLCLLYSANGIPPIVRIPSPDPALRWWRKIFRPPQSPCISSRKCTALCLHCDHP